jgi:2-haloacid dehalogenase
MPTKPTVILFDVYETLLDMSEVERRVNTLFDSKRAYTIWFDLFMEYCFVDNCTEQFNDFTSIAKATLSMAAEMLGTSVSEDQCNATVNLLKQLPVKEGVQEGLSVLNDDGYRIAALTNASEATVRQRMEMTGLISYFELVLSAEHVKKYKPCCEVYQWALKKLQVEPKEVLMVTSHSWDIAGAANAGLKTAYLKGKHIPYPLAPRADYTGDGIIEIADLLNEVTQDKD